MKKIVVFEISKHEEIVIDEREHTRENIEIAKQTAETHYKTLSKGDKKKRLLEVRIMKKENGELDYTEFDVIYFIGTETRF